MRIIAPAKINWTLEVLGKRPDGYHEIRSVMQTIDLCDEVEVNRAPDLLPDSLVREDLPQGTLVMRPFPRRFDYASYAGDAGHDGMFGESVIRAIHLLDPEGRRDARVSLTKKIPIGAGFGGGSSDAAAALRLLEQLWAMGWERGKLLKTAAELGSDVPFFLFGGTAIAEGRGERIEPLPDASSTWIVVVVPPIRLPEKTKRMYQALNPDHFSDGERTRELSQDVREGRGVREEALCNAFKSVAYEMFDGLERYRDALLAAGASGVHLAGAGPGLFALAEGETAAAEMASRIDLPDAGLFVARTLTAAEATAIVE